ncbi:hypothetical protein PSYMO_35465, partial [Pseudomonas amygdali pv. mori str. 301020]
VDIAATEAPTDQPALEPVKIVKVNIIRTVWRGCYSTLSQGHYESARIQLAGRTMKTM